MTDAGVLDLDGYDFVLPAERIAQTPARPREAARLLRVGAGLADHGVRDLPRLLRAGDLLVVNDTRVMPARLRARRNEAAIGLLLNRALADGVWQVLARGARKLRPGDALAIDGAPELDARVVDRDADGTVRIAFGPDAATLDAALARVGEVPLPPYIARPGGPTAADTDDYQTAFAERPGAVAAPTASLHFTPDLLAALNAAGVGLVRVTLHVGAGTFLPVRPDTTRLHAEWGEVTADAARAIASARDAGGRLIAVGTTALRLLETAADADGAVRPFRGLTELFLRPGHVFRTADLLLTNFHLPRSSLFLLVCAFAGTARMQAAYAHAIAAGYRFYSYGDATLLERAP